MLLSYDREPLGEHEKPARMSSTCIDLSCVTTPLASEVAWEVEALLLNVFEYADYSLRSALSGAYSEHLDCIFCLARADGVLVGAGGALCGRQNPTVAILGPVGILDSYRRRGIGTAIVRSLIDGLHGHGCEAVYLGVSSGHPALRLYERLGFVTYQGIVRRLSLHPPKAWEQTYFSPCTRVGVRRADWGDFPGVQALLCYPGSMRTVDLSRGIFSSRYVKPARFLPLFPEIMKTCQQRGGFADVLVTQVAQSVVGFAHVCCLPGEAQRHIAQFEFYVHDSFMDRARHLVHTMFFNARTLHLGRLRCGVLGGDSLKRRIVEDLGGTCIASLARSVCIKGTFEDVLIYEWEGTSDAELRACGTSI